MSKEIKEIREKILAGIELSYKRLLEQRKKEDGVLIICRDGKTIETVRAKDL
ncbi:MAG: hypothetical protein LBQ31_04010 [Bacteroidales bacterium]|jgi:hypothetical protein|nr:hypothetical protein [Bacteroidales bacterium]